MDRTSYLKKGKEMHYTFQNQDSSSGKGYVRIKIWQRIWQNQDLATENVLDKKNAYIAMQVHGLPLLY